jgi:hypothetical protein
VRARRRRRPHRGRRDPQPRPARRGRPRERAAAAHHRLERRSGRLRPARRQLPTLAPRRTRPGPRPRTSAPTSCSAPIVRKSGPRATSHLLFAEGRPRRRSRAGLRRASGGPQGRPGRRATVAEARSPAPAPRAISRPRSRCSTAPASSTTTLPPATPRA